MDKENIAHTYGGILFGLKEERNLPVCKIMGKPGGCYAKWNKLVTERQTLYDST